MVDTACVNREDITKESDLVDDLGIDSLEKVEVVMAIEREFNVTITDEDLEDVHTVAGLVKLVDDSIS